MAGVPHALLIAFPAQGHITPLMLLAKRLSSLGVLTTFVTTEYCASLILKYHSDSFLGQVRIAGVPDGLPPDFDRQIMVDAAFEHSLEGAVLKLLEKLSLDEQLPRVSCIIGDFFLPWTQSLASTVGLPEIVFWPQCAAAFAVYANLEQMISNGYNPFDDHVSGFASKKPTDQLVTCIPGLPPVHPADLPFEHKAGESGFPWLRAILQIRFSHIHEAAAVVGNSFEDLESKVCAALDPRLRLVGPLTPLSLVEEDNSQHIKSGSILLLEDDCSQWLNLQPPSSVVYISFGSLTELSVANLKELALGIAASQQRFLWVIRKDAMMDKSANAMEALPEGFLDRTKDKGKITYWAPQPKVLSHASVGGFFSHCGWNSTLESVCAGVPILGWPQMMDQMTNSWLISKEWKVGLELKKDETNQVERGDVENSLRTLMEGPVAEEMRARIAELKDAALTAMMTKGSSYRDLQLLVDDVLLRKSEKHSMGDQTRVDHKIRSPPVPNNSH